MHQLAELLFLTLKEHFTTNPGSSWLTCSCFISSSLVGVLLALVKCLLGLVVDYVLVVALCRWCRWKETAG